MNDLDYLKFPLALLLVVGLILLMTWALRRFSLVPGLAGPRKNSRLSIAETLPLDPKRRLVLVRDGAQEHLLLIGGDNDLLIRTGDSQAAQVAPDGTGR